MIRILLSFISFSTFWCATQASADVSSGGSLVSVPTKNPESPEDEEDNHLLRHHPFYVAYGRPLSKIQMSFKAPVVRKVPLYFGFTTFTFWALGEESKPFRDVTYNPELFYRWSRQEWSLLNSIDFGLWGHTSNGKQGEDSRSYEQSYVRFNWLREGTRWVTRFGLQLSYLHQLDYPNHDITEYISPLSFSISFMQRFDSWVDRSEIALQASPGGKLATRWGRGGYQLSWSFRPGRLELVRALYLQYYYGHAETLLNYEEKVSEFRAGLIF